MRVALPNEVNADASSCSVAYYWDIGRGARQVLCPCRSRRMAVQLKQTYLRDEMPTHCPRSRTAKRRNDVNGPIVLPHRVAFQPRAAKSEEVSLVR